MEEEYTKAIRITALFFGAALIIIALVSTAADIGVRIVCGVSGAIICLSVCNNALQRRSSQKGNSHISKKISHNTLGSKTPNSTPTTAMFYKEVQGADHFITTEEALAEFMQQYSVIAERRTKVVGVTYRNDDGSNRQSILARCHAGDDILLRYFEYHGSPAYGVQTEQGQIGNLSKELARELGQYGDDVYVSGRILSVTGGSNGQYFGCNIVLTIYGPK